MTRGRGPVLACALLACQPANVVAARDGNLDRPSRPHRLHLRRDVPAPFFVPPERELLPPLPEPLPPPPTGVPRAGPSAPIGPLPSGFTMTLTQGAEPDPDRDAAIGKPRDIARRLAACWSPPDTEGAPAEITLRLQFSKAGRIIGTPRVSYVAAPTDQRAAVVKSMQTALKDCTPLRFTARLGAGIAGYPFAIRFIAAQRKTDNQP
jgi:hypothetical protein